MRSVLVYLKDTCTLVANEYLIYLMTNLYMKHNTKFRFGHKVARGLNSLLLPVFQMYILDN